MAQHTLIFEVKHRVPVKSLTKLIELARDLECELVSTVQLVEAYEEVKPALPARPMKALEHKTVRTLDPAKTTILEKLKAANKPLPRRDLIRALKDQGFKKNSVGPLCTELKKEGMIVNYKRGFWSLPPEAPKERPAKPVPAKEVNEPA